MSRSERRAPRFLREMRVSFVLALPLALGQLAAMLMNVVDSLLAGRHGLRTLAAVTVGSSIWTVALLACVGLMMAIPPSVSRTYEPVKPWVWIAARTASNLSLLVGLMKTNATC